MSYRLYLPLILLILVVGCQGDRGALTGSSKDETSGYNLSLPADASLYVTPEEIMGDPAAFIGDHLQLTGDLYRLPMQKCDSKARTFPANWILTDGDLEIPIASASQELSQLATDLSGVILAGRWLHWKGMVGCGRETEVDEQWYLDVYRIVSPNPIALVPVLSVSPIQRLEDSGLQPVSPGTVEPTIALTSPTPPAVAGGQITDTVTPVPQQVIMSPTVGALASIAVSATAPITPSPEGSQSSFQSTSTPTQGIPDPLDTTTPTLPSASPTAVVTVENTPAATATGSPVQPIFRMALDVSSIETGRLDTNETHRWTHEITSTKQLTVSLASDYHLDVAVSIVDPAGQAIAQKNTAINGEPEILAGVTLMDPGIYDILVSSPSGDPGYYAILISDSESYSYIFQGTLLINDNGNAAIASESDHFWHFTGTAGQAISISVVPTDDSDLFLNLFGTDGVSLIRFHDETASGEPEQIIGYVLPETGIYSLRIGEFNFGSSEYEIFLTDS